ncbi:hypothetical protein [Planctomonas psychrotolerans]|uniref:hypothetical protein n=1 Tax=Planctomonas psychrotolerans TaxID=2528712 RepID=UPI00123BA2C5|nr:hypothetical protein [Planctomonas psychrotolerans]
MVRRITETSGFIPWWYVAGAILSIVVSIALSDVLNTTSSTALMWGPIIGIEIRERHLAANHRLPPTSSEPQEPRRDSTPRWLEPTVATLLTSLTLGVGSILGSTLFFRDGPPDWPAATVGGVLVLVSMAGLGVLVMLRRTSTR